MTVDFHTHIFPDGLAPRALQGLSSVSGYNPVTDMTLSGLLVYMDKHGIDRSVVQPVVTKPSQTVHTNEWAREICSDRIISFGGIHPDTDDYKRDIDFVSSLGLKGLKFHAEYQNFLLDEPRMLRIYDYAASKGLIMLHHAGFDPAFKPPFRTSPKRFAHLLDELPGAIFVAAHFGGQQQWDEVEEYLVGRDIYLDTSMGTKYYGMERFARIVKAHGAEKILFASDSPWSDAASEAAAIGKSALSEREKALILGENAAKLLGTQPG